MSTRTAYEPQVPQPRNLLQEPWAWVSIVVAPATLVLMFFVPMPALAWHDEWEFEFLKTLTALAVVAIFVERVVEVFVGLWQDPRVDVLLQQLEMEEAVQVHRREEIKRLTTKLADANLPAEDKQKARQSIALREQEMLDSEAAAEKLQRQLVVHRAATRRIATWSGLLIGVLVAAVGFRILGNLVDVKELRQETSAAEAKSASPAPDNTPSDPPADGAQASREAAASAIAEGEDEGEEQKGKRRQWTAAEINEFQFAWFVVVDVLLTAAVLAGGSQAIHKLFNVFDTVMDTSQSIAQKRKLVQATPPVPPAGA